MWIGIAVLATGILLGAWLVSRFGQQPGDDRVFVFQIDPPAGGQFVFGANVGGISLSPDGRTAAYVASVNGKSELWVRPLDGTMPRRIAGTEGAAHPFWSPDNKSIAFFTATKLKRVDLASGSPLVICDVASPRGGAWTDDGRILFGTTMYGLLQVSASGGTPSRIAMFDRSRREASLRSPLVLPGGRLLLWVSNAEPENSGVYASSMARPEHRLKVLTTDTSALYARAGGRSYLLWMRSTTLVAQEFDMSAMRLVGEPHPIIDPVGRIGAIGLMNAAVSANGVLLYSSSSTARQFTWFDQMGKPVGTVGEAGEYGTFRLSPDGHFVAASRDRPMPVDLWLLDVERGGIGRFTSDSKVNMYPVWSPDGAMIAYSSGSSRNLFRKQSSGGTEEQLTHSANVQFPTDWSRDGKWILYYEYAPDSGVDIWVLPVERDGNVTPNAQPRPWLRTPFNEKEGRFSPESPPRWIAYQSDITGRNEIYIQAFPEPHGQFQISTAGGQYPQWAEDGRELFYVSLDSKLMAVKLKVGAASVTASTPQELFLLPALDIGVSPYEASSDGRRFLVRATMQAREPLTVVTNWPALLRKGIALP